MDKHINEFVEFVADKLRMDKVPEIHIDNDPKFATSNKTFGIYYPDENMTVVEVYGRNIVDVLRTIAHELTHHRQNEVGSKKNHVDLEIEATYAAGILVKLYCANHPDLYGSKEMK